MKRRSILTTMALVIVLATALFAMCSVAFAEECEHQWKAGLAPTCKEAGNKICTVCGAVEAVAATGNHSWKVGQVATCGAEGNEICTVCGETKTTPATGNHSWKVGQALTCGDDGKEICTVCGETKTTPATGNHTWKTGKVATCSEEGSEICTVCGKDRAVAKLPHTEKELAAKAATCTETGLTAGKQCTVCDAITVQQEVVPAAGHTEKELAAKAATCTETGLTAGKQCTVCDEITKAQETVAALGHTEVMLAAKMASCTETGLTAGKQCTVCGVVTEEQKEIPAMGHTEKAVEDVAATCTTDGLVNGIVCANCGEVIHAQEIVPATGHDYRTTKIAATTTSKGYTRHTCKVCGDVYKTNWVAKLTAAPAATIAPVATAAPVEAVDGEGYGSIVTDELREAEEYEAVLETKVVEGAETEAEDNLLVITAALEEDGTYAIRNLHLTFELIEDLKAEGIEYISFIVGDKKVDFALSIFENENLALVMGDMDEELTGYVLTVDPNAVNEEGKAGCQVQLMLATAEGTEIEVTTIVTGIVLVMEEVEIEVTEGIVYTLPEEEEVK